MSLLFDRDPDSGGYRAICCRSRRPARSVGILQSWRRLPATVLTAADAMLATACGRTATAPPIVTLYKAMGGGM